MLTLHVFLHYNGSPELLIFLRYKNRYYNYNYFILIKKRKSAYLQKKEYIALLKNNFNEKANLSSIWYTREREKKRGYYNISHIVF